MSDSFTPTKWPNPSLALPSTEVMARMLADADERDKLVRALMDREDLIRLEQSNPLQYGYEPPQWRRAAELLANGNEQLIMGGNRSTKSTYAAKACVRALMGAERRRVACFHTSEESSKTIQQAYIYAHLPPQFRDMGKKGRVINVSYTQKNGFSDASFVLPNRSQCWFHNYGQFHKDPRAFEGGEFDLIWLDEPLPFALLSTLRHRVTSRRGKILITFTPVDGYDSVVNDFLANAKLIESKPYNHALVQRLDPAPDVGLPAEQQLAPGCPPGHMPYVMDGSRRGQSVVYFWTAWNPYHPIEESVQKVAGRPRAEVLMRLYGFATKMSGNQFPRFDNNVHVVKAGKVPSEGTNYFAIDPASARNPFMLWARCAEDGCVYIYREWPDVRNYGEWVTADGGIGEAQRSGAGRTCADIASMILDIEARNKETIHRRAMDKKAAATPSATAGVPLTQIFEELPTPMIFEPAPTQSEIRLDVMLINNWLGYNPNAPVTAVNQPRLYISEECENLIFCMHNWNIDDGQKSPHKDPIDCLREVVAMDPEYLDPKTPHSVPGFGF